MTDDATLVRERILAGHADLLGTVADCAEAVAAGWDGDATADREAVVPPLRAALERAGALSRLPSLLHTAAEALGTSLPAEPVAAPPYVVVTATGPVVRATFPDRGRLVVEIRVFAVEPGGGGDDPRYRRVTADDADPSPAVGVAFR
ncbi:hypothetical protein HUG10_04910 [Halorarum halophilum]|uniref:DUF7988 domain-containing protein n=1 Tax=Halorarum halophilum TaxID=2743090 RepID=A0A7D5KU40_9EURY|nr:hypothetical protein [Halobaculum halophilum]QLG26920.1 hypothetical protein HUG10_04910 [Halobaculum halophilum]